MRDNNMKWYKAETSVPSYGEATSTDGKKYVYVYGK